MKKSDLAMLLLIASVSVMTAFFIAKSVIGDVSNETAKVKTIELIKPDIVSPDPEIFNKDAINPAVPVELKGTE